MGLTRDQQAALDCCMKQNNVFITGGGGVGKTYLIHKIVDSLEEAGRSVMLTASTGRAAQLIGGATCHRAFKIPLKMAWNRNPRVSDSDPVCAADTIIIDEISMVRMDVFGYIVRCMQNANRIRKENEKPPIQMIVVGDFFQLPPVVVVPKDGVPGDADLMAKHYGFDVGGAYAFLAPEWLDCGFVVCELREVVRQTDRKMISLLNRLRYGDPSALTSIRQATRKKPYPPDEENVIYLCGKNRTADKINREALSRLPGSEWVYKSTVEGTVSEQDKPSPDILRLRKGARVMMLQNSDDYVNGSTGTIVGLGDKSVRVLLNDNTEVTVGYACWEVTTYVMGSHGSVKLEVIGWYYQLPLRPAYAVTIHRSQGQTLKKAVLCVGRNGSEVFTGGQLYVGMSRITDLGNLYIKGDLRSVSQLASKEVLDYYSSIGIDIAPVSASMEMDPIPAPAVELPKHGRKARNVGKRNGKTKKIQIPVAPIQRPVIMAFAQVLDPDAYEKNSCVFVSKDCAEAVKDFLAQI